MFGRRRGRFSGVLVISGVMLLPVVERWARAESAEDIINHGVQLRREGRDREALAAFREAEKIERSPKVIAQIGFAEQALGLWLASDTHEREALSHADDAWIKKNRAIIERALALTDAHIGTIDIWGDPAGAEVLLDSAPVGVLPLAKPVRATAGTVTITVRAEGFQSVTRTLQVVGEQLTRENVVLVRLSPSPSLASSPAGEGAKKARPVPLAQNKAGAAGPEGGPVLVAKPPAPAPAEPPENRSILKRWWFWTAVGVVVAGGIVAGIALSGKSAPGCPTGAFCPPN